MVATLALDTNIAIDFLNGKPTIVNLISQYESICLPITVCGELLFGAKNSGNAIKNIQKYQNFIDTCLVLETNQLIANEYANTRLELKAKGKPIPENDIWIAAICIVNDIPLISHDKHFENIDKLQLIKPHMI
ncbi:MAG: type II toxin-antitoxin system VapC family toxin [Arcicella sp.]|nr:type II toxin-antitoxin system VapC family toxin [Microscillaceae bacterium]MCU0471170.1 type II toxin-antitoxin system VapC family toxin [Arcicella sp.]